jgi:hypothetical protein
MSWLPPMSLFLALTLPISWLTPMLLLLALWLPMMCRLTPT